MLRLLVSGLTDGPILAFGVEIEHNIALKLQSECRSAARTHARRVVLCRFGTYLSMVRSPQALQKC